jgi:uncharacterized membrane protein HdeD (DUF308 family)
MATVFALNWWTLALRGALALIIGLIAFVVPTATLFAVTVLFGAYALIAGLASLTAAFRSSSHGERWWELLFAGIAGVAAAVVTLVWPAVTLVFLIYVIGGWALVTGIFEIMAAMRLRRHIEGEWMLVLAGITSVFFGLLLFIFPGVGALILTWWIGAYAILSGILMLALAFRIRRLTSSGSLRPRHA